MKTPKGTRDLLPEETRLFQAIEQRAIDFFGRYGFQEIRTPLFEETSLFIRGIGDETDIVTKEMYRFQTKGGDDLTLRPEMTASVCRAVVQHHLVGKDELLRLLYMGPMFRYERPQAGRYRQFHQLGAEVFGSADPLIDAETIQALIAFLEPYQLPNLTLHLNSVGDETDRPQYLAYLREALTAVRDQLCADCQRRLETNVLRLLDCKNPTCRQQLVALKPISDFWSAENRQHFEAVCNYLAQVGIRFEINPFLVRGLDYYTKTAFELLSGDLGAQSAVMGGGRYDKLLEQIGGSPTPAFGWALGIDRLVTLIRNQGTSPEPATDLFFVFGERAWLDESFALICQLRAQGFSVLYDPRVGSFKSQMKRANKHQARLTAIIGESEYQSKTVTLKDMAKSEQQTLALDQLASYLKEVLAC